MNKKPTNIGQVRYSSWYIKHLVDKKILQDAGMKENIFSGILGALVFVLAGYSVSDASRKVNVPEEQVEQALLDSSKVDEAKDILRKMKEENKSTEKTPLNSFMEEAFTYIGGHEGMKLKEYIDTKGHPTIGIGHKILPGEDFSMGITEDEAKQLFSKDIQERLSATKGLFPNFDSYPNYVKVALLDGVFRGDHKSIYRTTKLINKGNWIEASKEYLRNEDYYASQKSESGVAPRMEDNSKRMEQYGRELI